MRTWEQRADSFRFIHRTRNNNDKVSLITSHAFKFNKPIEMENEGSYLQLGKWRFIEQGEALCIQSKTIDASGNILWTTKLHIV